MKTAVNQLHEKVAVWTTEIANILALAQKLNLPPPDLQSYHHKIAKLYSEELDLCYLLDKSDIIFHANGTAITDHSFGLSAVNSLFKNIDQQIKRHALSVLQLRNPCKTQDMHAWCGLEWAIRRILLTHRHCYG